jgi:hypothetical protein
VTGCRAQRLLRARDPRMIGLAVAVASASLGGTVSGAVPPNPTQLHLSEVDTSVGVDPMRPHVRPDGDDGCAR